jgi:hypothetical protein
MDPPDVMNSNVIFVERDTPVSDASGQLVWGRTSLWSHRRCSRRRVIAEGVCEEALRSRLHGANEECDGGRPPPPASARKGARLAEKREGCSPPGRSLEA